MYCENCGSRLPDGAKFCTECGTRVQVPTASEAPRVILPDVSEVILPEAGAIPDSFDDGAGSASS